MPRSTGKYAAVIGHLPRLVQEGPYQEKVNQRKYDILNREEGVKEFFEVVDEVREELKAAVQTLMSVNHKLSLIKALSPSTAAAVWAELRGVEETIEESASETRLNLEALKQILIDAYEREDVSSLKLVTGDTVRTQYEPYAKVIDKDLHRQWAMDNGLKRSLSLPWQTTNALTKELLLKAQPAPAGVEATSNVKVVLTRG